MNKVSRKPLTRIETAVAAFLTVLVAGAVAVFYHAHSFNWPLAEDYIYLTFYHFIVGEHGELSQILLLHQGPHPMAVEIGLGIALMRIFGVGVVSLKITNYLLMLTAALLLALRVSRDLKTVLLRIAVWPLMVILFFHPIQTDSLQKPADMGWLLVSFLLVADAVAIEYFKTPAAALPGAIIGTLCFAQGNLLSLVAALHSLLLPGPWKKRVGWAVALVVMFAAVGVFSMRIRFGHSDAMDVVNVSAGVVPLARYFVELLGSLFGSRSPLVLIVLGLALIAIAVAFISARFKATLAADRIAFCMIAYGLLATVMFTAGRFHFGLPWVLSAFHASALIVPFAVGIAILAMRLADSGNRGGWVVLAFMMTSVVTALPYGLQRARESNEQREVAMTLSCHGGLSEDMFRAVNGVPPDDPEAQDDLPELRHLCDQKISEATAHMMQLPQSFQTIIAKDETARAPLEILWRLYLFHFDLQEAMPFGQQDASIRLLNWARANALSGANYDPMLDAYRPYFRSLPPRS